MRNERRWLRSGILVTLEVLPLLPFLLPLGSAFAQGLVIDHRQVGCVVAERFPLISARFGPASNVGQARVYFRAAGGPHWYFVEMKVQGADYVAALPKPKNSTPKIEYYIEALDTTFAASRTAEYAPDVVPPPGACGRDGILAPALTSAKLVVGAAAGASALPLGFSAAGMAAATGGISTLLVVGVVGAGAAVATVAASSGGSTKSTQASSPPTTGLPPPTTPPSLTGHWVGTGADGLVVLFRRPGRPDCPTELDASLDISQSGSGLSGMGTFTVRKATGPPCGTVGAQGPVTLTGSVSGSSLTIIVNFLSGTPDATTLNLNGTAAANRMSGMVSGSGNDGSTITGTWAINRQ